MIDDINILTGTLSLIRGAFRKADINIVSNFDPAKIKTKPYKNIYFTRGTTVKDKLKELATKEKHIILIDKDIVFNDYLLHSIPRDRSALVFDNRPMSRSELCGLTQNNKVLRLAYGLDDKNKNVHTFSHIFAFGGQELKLLKEILETPKYKNLDLFEIVNLIIDEGGEFEVAVTKKSKALEITCPKDLKAVRRLMS